MLFGFYNQNKQKYVTCFLYLFITKTKSFGTLLIYIIYTLSKQCYFNINKMLWYLTLLYNKKFKRK